VLNLAQIGQIRDFNRQYVIQLGVLSRKTYQTDLTWPQARLVIEMGLHHLNTPIELSRQLNLDKSYTSRLIKQLVSRGIIVKEPSAVDARSINLRLTPDGDKIFQQLNQRSNQQVQALLSGLTPDQQTEFFTAIQTINTLIFPNKK
jgi:DNA-binding MarR family transcriptional regulator